MHLNYIIVGCVLFVLILLTMTSSCSYVPHHRTSAYLNEYTYEGMEGEEQEGMEDEEKEGMEDEGMEDEEKEGFALTGDEKTAYEEYKKAKDAFTKSKKAWDAIVNKSGTEGFTGSNYTANSFILDQFSSAVGAPSCVGKSSGLSNSTGPLCLSDDQKRLLQTRGGNASSGESKI